MSAIQNLSPEQRDEVRGQVRALLDRTEAFQHLSPEQRQKVARGLVTVVGYLADPAAGQKELAGALADQKTAGEKTGDRLANKQDLVGKDFKAAGVKAGTDGFKDMVDSVDFPKFVSGLIEGVFKSIVDASIRQMEAYGKLLEGVVKSVEQFANDHITPNQARDYVRNRYPDAMRIDTSSGSPRLAPNENLDDERMPNFQKDFGLQQAPDFSEPESEAAIVRAAQLQMAKMRQQQLSTMVLLGINRIVVTDGLINAKVVFDMKASDTAKRRNTASLYDSTSERENHYSESGWFSDSFDSSSRSHDVVVSSATSDDSESKAQVKAQLSGEVRVNFKSETFPLEKMASSGQMGIVQERAQRE
ncbi:hypothetical protein P2318_16605 [Myxococcaceae bacterium GXIMD 01537]